MLKTVHWALTAVLAVAALLVGYGWFTNFKMADRDRQRLKEETLNDANKNVLQLRAELETALQAAVASVNDQALRFKHEVSNLATSLSAAAEKRTIQFADDITKRLESHRHETDGALRDILGEHLPQLETKLMGAIAKTSEQASKDLRSTVNQLNRNLFELSFKLHDNLGDQAAKTKTWSAALTWYLRALQEALKIGSEFLISHSLMNLDRSLTSGGLPIEDEKQTMAQLEKQVPQPMLDQYQQVNRRIQNARVFAPS
jgi:hypothetical protein